MRILHCHIENFGKLHQLELDLTDKNVLVEENGWGKSTFAAFICAMFYGLEGDRKRGLESERRRYAPWQGGPFGGRILFEAGGKKYILTRIFSEKENLDTFELRDYETNLLSHDYSVRIGEELFHINRNSFRQTAFINQSDCAQVVITDDIHALAGHFTDADDRDINAYEKAQESLKEVLNKLTPSRATGSINKRKSEISKLQQDLRGEDQLKTSLQDCQELYRKELLKKEELQEEQKEILKLQEQVSGKQEALLKIERWDELRQDIRNAQEEVDKAKKKFTAYMPSIEEIDQMLTTTGRLTIDETTAGENQLDPSEKDEYYRLNRYFGDNAPSSDEIESHKETAVRVLTMHREMAAKALNASEEARYLILRSRFEEDDQLDQAAEYWYTRNLKKQALPADRERLQRLITENQKKPSVSLMIMGLLLAVIGIGLTIFWDRTLGLLFTGISILIAIIGFIVYRVSKKQPPDTEEIIELRERIQEDEAYLPVSEAYVQDYFSRYGILYTESSAEMELQNLYNERKDYREISKRKETYEETVRNNTSYQGLCRGLEGFLRPWFPGSDVDHFYTDLTDLESRSFRFRILSGKYERFARASEAAASKRDILLEFLEKCGVAPEENLQDQLLGLRSLRSDYQDKVEDFEAVQKRAEEFVKKVDIQSLPTEESLRNLPDADSLRKRLQAAEEKLEKVNENLENYRRSLDGKQEELENLEDKRDELQELQELQKQEETKYHLTEKASKLLEEAKNRLTLRYRDPIYESFCKYYRQVSGKEASHYKLSAESKLTYEESGRQRQPETLSTGLRDLTGLCLRLALIDAMYAQADYPVIIMDDPFVNLDDEKLQMARALLEEVSKEYQVIYLTCSEKRA